MPTSACVRSLAMTLVLLAGSFACAASQLEYPYAAYVRQDGTPVRSGPDQAFYETDRIALGTTVEVYRHDAGGWCAVRPPRGSYSWVAADVIAVTANPAVGQIKTDDAMTRVGTRFNDVHDVEYIRLRRDELVEILGAEVLKESDGSPGKRWYKIAPPAGEFRWIHRDHLSLEPLVHDLSVQTAAEATEHSEATVDNNPLDAPPPYQPEGDHANLETALDAQASVDSTRGGNADRIANPSERTTAKPDTVADDNSELTLTSDARDTDQNAGWELGNVEDLRRDESTPVSVDGVPVVASESQQPRAETETTETPNANATPEKHSGAWRVTSSTDAAAELLSGSLEAAVAVSNTELLSDLNVRLSHEILKPIGQWKLSGLRDEAQRWQREPATSTNRESQLNADQFLTKVDEFDRLQMRHRQAPELFAADGRKLSDVRPTEPRMLPDFELDAELVAGIDNTMPRRVAGGEARPNAPVSILSKSKAPVALANYRSAANRNEPEATDHYTATGWLIPVKSKRSDVPRFALTDREGRIMDFLTVPSDANLRGLLGKHVGVVGQRGFSTKMRKPQLVASRIVLLNR